MSIDNVSGQPQHLVSSEQALDPRRASRPRNRRSCCTNLGFGTISSSHPAAALVTPATRWTDDASGVRLLNHFSPADAAGLSCATGSGLRSVTDPGWPRLASAHRDHDEIERSSSSRFAARSHLRSAPPQPALSYQGRAAHRCKVSWQNGCACVSRSRRSRAGQLRDMCIGRGSRVVAIRRIRIGRISLGKMPVGAWRCLPSRRAL